MARGQHINTFEKGMTSDVNILYQPNGTYRYMKNCQLISQDGNNFAIKDCLGNTLIFELNIPYITYTVGPPASFTMGAYPMAIGFISFPNKLVVLSTNSELDGGGYGEIGVLNYVTYGEGIQPVIVAGNDNNGYVPLYNHIDLDFSKMHRIEGFAYSETEEIQRIYWTDNNNEPRVFNVADPIFTTYIASGSLVSGQQYMVVEGVIAHPVASANYYGPTDAATTNIIGTVFTASTTTYTDLTAGSPTAKVIEYFPIQLLNFTPSRTLGNIKFKNYGSGSVYCGAKIYFYRLTKPAEGINTSWSYGCSPIHVGTDNDVTASPANPFFDFTGGGSSTTLVNSGHSVVITIDNIDTNFTNIEVAVAEYDQTLEVIRAINTIANETITSSTMDITHTGSNNLGELTLLDITLFPASILKCKTLTTNKNYILIGNIEERAEFDSFDNSTITMTQIAHRMRTHQSEYGAAGTAQVCENVMSYNIKTSASDVTPSTAANPALVNGIPPYTEWIVLGGVAATNYVTYNGVNYGAETAGQFFRGVPGVYNYTITGVGITVRPAVYKNKYTTIAGVDKPTGIQFDANDSDQWTYKNPAVAHLKKGYWSNQTYRFGILFYDLKGNPYYVRWLDDFPFDTCVNVPLTTLTQVNSGGDDDWYLTQNGLRISGITIPASIIDLISGFSIVRAERDATIMTQGIVKQVMYNAPIMFNLPSPNNAADSLYTNNNGQVMTYICPDNLIAYPIQNYTTGSDLTVSHFVIPRDAYSTGARMKTSSDGDQAFETKYLEVAAAEATPDPDPSKPILAKQDFQEGESTTNFGSGNWNYYNQTRFSALAAPTVDSACSGGAYAFGGTGGVGGPRTLFEIDDALWGYNQYNVTNYGDITNANLNNIIGNITITKTNLYGGQSPQALANTFYISTGHFQPITAQVKTDTLSGGNYVFNNVDVWGGDCYNCLITYGNTLYGPTIFNPSFADPQNSWAIKFACQCNSNYDLRKGRLVEAVRMYPAAAGVGYTASPLLEGFSYNKGYSSQGLAFLYPALPVNFSTSGTFPFRVRYAGQKFIGEIVNSFRNFAVLDFKDMDGHGGEINNLKTKDGRTIAWQQLIVSSIPILERIINSSADGAPTTLGTGGVADRFDPISSYFGNQHQWSLVETEYGFAWFDMDRKAYVILNMGSGIAEVSQINGLKGYFDELFLEVLGNTAPSGNVVNSQTFASTSDRPLQGVGIDASYDPKFKMTYITFKFYSREVVPTDKVSNIAKDITVGYYHPAKAFVSLFDWTPANTHTHNQTLFSVKNPQNKTKYYGADMASTDFVIGDVVSYKNAEYMCIADVTIASYPGTAPQQPDATSSAYWYKINQTNQIWAHNQPTTLSQNPAPDYLYSSFFGQPVEGEIWIVINPKTNNPFSVLNMEQIGNNEYMTDVETSNGTNSAADNDITTTNRNYKIIYNSLTSSLPLDVNGIRLTDNYLLVKIKKKNWSSPPYTMDKNPKILEMLKSVFEEKR